MAVGDVYRVEAQWQVGSQPTMNVMHAVQMTEETLLDNPATGLIEVMSDLFTNFAMQLAETVRCITIYCIRVHPTTGIPATVVFGGGESIVGQIEDWHCAPQVAVLVSLYTTNPTRHGRGRIYIPGWPQSNEHNGQMTEEAHGAMTAACADLTNTLGPAAGATAEFRVCVSSAANDYAALPVQDYIVRPNLATQRRRRAFPGFNFEL